MKINQIKSRLSLYKTFIKLYIFYFLTLIKSFFRIFSPKSQSNDYKLTWFGAYGNTNIGDDLIFFSLQQFIPDNIKIELSCRQEHPTTNYGVQTFFRNNFEQYYRIKYSDFVLLGGGGLFEYYRRAFPIKFLIGYIYPLLMAKYYGKKYGIIGMGCNQDAMPNLLLRYIFRYVIRNASFIITRDEKSYNGFLNNGGSPKNIRVSFDPVFSYNLPEIKYKNKSKKTVGFLIWPFYLYPNFHNNITDSEILATTPIEKLELHNKFVSEIKILLQILKDKNYELVFPVFHFSDNIILRQLGIETKKSIKMEDYFNEISFCDTIVTMRYHGQITSLLSKKSIVSIIVQEKMEALVKNFELQDYSIDIDNFNAYNCFNQIENTFTKETELRSQNNSILNEIRNNVTETYKTQLKIFFNE